MSELPLNPSKPGNFELLVEVDFIRMVLNYLSKLMTL